MRRCRIVPRFMRYWAIGGLRPCHPTLAATERGRHSLGPTKLLADRHATRDEVLSALGSKSARIIDARSAAEYTGSEKRSKRGTTKRPMTVLAPAATLTGSLST
ncbi:MAG: hypothetical protein ACHRXM_11605 [Isosphaerales bacterium]